MNNISDSTLSIADSVSRLEDKVVEDINQLKDTSVDFDLFFRYVFKDCCGCVDKECNIVELRNTNLSKVMRYATVAFSEAPLQLGKVKRQSSSLENLDEISKEECNKIRVGNGDVLSEVYGNVKSISMSKIALVLKFVELFRSNGLIKKKQNMYFLLDSNMRLTWNNIKRLTVQDIKGVRKDTIEKLSSIYFLTSVNDMELLLIIKSLFWYFRKAIVDSILSDIISLEDLNVKAMSVGSTKLTSDYDITLDGTYKSCGKVIMKYNRFVEVLFMDDSESVFDTNVYGVSFIKEKGIVITPDINDTNDSNKIITDAFNKEHLKCGGFNYILSNDKDFIISQHIWAFIKLLMNLNKVQDEEVFGLFLLDLSKNFGDNLYYKTAGGFMNKYESNTEYYQKTVSDANRFLDKVQDGDEKSKYIVSNFISYVNYNGSETYLTNGAFLDVVVNNQMCRKKREDMIALDFNSYLDSFIENLSDLIVHYHKTKYLDRARDAFKKMLELGIGFDSKLSCDLLLKRFECESGNIGEYIIGILDKIRKIQEDCGREILDCQIFIMMYYILYCIIIVFKRYMEWSNITGEELINGTERFDKLDFKNFRIPLESKIKDII